MQEISFIQWLEEGYKYAIGFAALCSALGVIGAWIHRFYKAARKPQEELEGRVVAVEATLEEHTTMLNKGSVSFKEMREESNLLIRGLMQLITHELDGNHVDKLAKVRDDMQNYLIER